MRLTPLLVAVVTAALASSSFAASRSYVLHPGSIIAPLGAAPHRLEGGLSLEECTFPGPLGSICLGPGSYFVPEFSLNGAGWTLERGFVDRPHFLPEAGFFPTTSDHILTGEDGVVAAKLTVEYEVLSSDSEEVRFRWLRLIESRSLPSRLVPARPDDPFPTALLLDLQLEEMLGVARRLPPSLPGGEFTYEGEVESLELLATLSINARQEPVALGLRDILVADFHSRAVFVLDPVTGARTILSSRRFGVGEGAFMRNPRDVAVGPLGEIYVLEGFTGQVLRIDPETGDRVDLGGAGLQNPKGIAVDGSSGLLLVADTHTVQEFDPHTGITRVLSGRGVGSGPPFAFARGLALEADGGVIVADGPGLSRPNRNRIVRIEPDTGNRTVVSSSEVGSGPMFGGARRVVILPNGEIILSTINDNTLFAIHPETGDRKTFDPYSGAGVDAVALDIDGSIVWSSGSIVLRSRPTPGVHRVISRPSDEGEFITFPGGIAIYCYGDRIMPSLFPQRLSGCERSARAQEVWSRGR